MSSGANFAAHASARAPLDRTPALSPVQALEQHLQQVLEERDIALEECQRWAGVRLGG